MIDIPAVLAELARVLRETPELRRAFVEALGIGADPERQLSVKQYAALHGIGESTTRAAIYDGRLEATKVGGSVRIKASATISAPRSADTPTARAARAWSKVSAGGGR